jgi:hypothetical protein
MKKHRIFNKGDYVYCLLSSHNKPNILLPVKGIIVDTKWDPVNPKYQIRILKFYDHIPYLKRYFFDMNFIRSFGGRGAKLPLNKEDYPSVTSLEKRITDKDYDRFFVVVDSLMCTKTSVNLKDLFEKVQFYLISKNLKEIREFTVRPFFKGPLSIDSSAEFDKRFKKAWSDKFERSSIDIDKYLSSLG